MLDTTAKGSCGSRGSSRAGSKVDSGATGFSGKSKTGRPLGAQAAICGYGAAIFRGGASGFWKAEGRSMKWIRKRMKAYKSACYLWLNAYNAANG